MGQITNPSIFNQIEAMNHEQVMIFNDGETGLKGIIGIHNTTLGPSLGGTRIWRYDSEEEAMHDVLRLSRGMTFKSAISGINLGGGKAVIIDHDNAKKDEAFWRRYGKFVNNLGGKYITAEDVGTNPMFMEYIAMETQFVAGKPAHLGGGGDPSPVTAYGVYLGMKACQKKLSGSDSLSGKKVAVQGVGHVGQFLVSHLVKEGAQVFVSDVNDNHLKKVTSEHQVTVVDVADIYHLDMDIYAPCALGATINDQTIDTLSCSIVAGAANNQLEDETIHAKKLKDKGILYAPDFLINAGGVINCYVETLGNYDEQRAYKTTEQIYDRTLEILRRSEREDISTHDIALKMAMERITSIGQIKKNL